MTPLHATVNRKKPSRKRKLNAEHLSFGKHNDF